MREKFSSPKIIPIVTGLILSCMTQLRASNSPSTSHTNIPEYIHTVNAKIGDATTGLDATSAAAQGAVTNIGTQLNTYVNTSQLALLSMKASYQNAIKNTVEQTIQNTADTIAATEEATQKTASKIGDFIGSAINSITNIFSTTQNTISSFFNNLSTYHKIYSEDEITEMRKTLSNETTELLTNNHNVYVKEHLDTINAIRSSIGDLTPHLEKDANNLSVLTTTNEATKEKLVNTYDSILTKIPNSSVGIQLLIDSTGGAPMNMGLLTMTHKDYLNQLCGQDVQMLIKLESHVMELTSQLQHVKDETQRTKLTELLNKVTSLHENLSLQVKEKIYAYYTKYDGRTPKANQNTENFVANNSQNLFFDIEGFNDHVKNIEKLDTVQEIASVMEKNQAEIEAFSAMTKEAQIAETKSRSEEFKNTLKEQENQTLAHLYDINSAIYDTTDACVYYPSGTELLTEEHAQSLKNHLLSIIENTPSSSYALECISKMIGGAYIDENGNTINHKDNIQAMLKDTLEYAKNIETILQSEILALEGTQNAYRDHLNDVLNEVKNQLKEYVSISHTDTNTAYHIYLDHSELHDIIDTHYSTTEEGMSELYAHEAEILEKTAAHEAAIATHTSQATHVTTNTSTTIPAA